jgi:hypothetical protein
VRGGLEALILLGFHGFRCNRPSCEIGISRPVDTTARRMVFSLHVATPHIADDPTDRPCGVDPRTRPYYLANRCGTIRRVSRNTTPESQTPHRKARGFSFLGPEKQKKNHHATIEPNPGQTQ